MNKRYSDFAEELVIKNQKNEAYEYTMKENEDIVCHHIHILKENNTLKKAIGNYISIEVKKDLIEVKEALEVVVFKQVKEMIMKLNHVISKVMIVGLGNDKISADAFGCLVLSKIHQEPLNIEYSLITPGVSGRTSISTYDHVCSLIQCFQPDLIICIDALATSKLQRLYQVVQINDVGISPGAGVGNHQKPLNKVNLKTPIICIGVATVISISSILYDMIYDYDEVINEEYLDTMVSFKSMDFKIEWMSDIVAHVLNKILRSLS